MARRLTPPSKDALRGLRLVMASGALACFPAAAQGESGVAIAGTLGLGQNLSVPGETEASALSIGYRLDAAVETVAQEHRLEARLAVDQAYSYSFVAASPMILADDVVLSGSYRFLPTDFFGLATEVELETSPLGAVHVSPRRFSVAGSDAPPTQIWPVSDPFDPTALRGLVAAAFFADPSPYFGVDFLVGVSHQHSFGQALILERDEDATLTFAATRDAHSFGPATRLAIDGGIDGLFFYSGEARVVLPFLGTNLDGILASTAWDLRARIALKLTDWLEVRYRIRGEREPLRSDPWTLQNDAVLAFVIEDSLDEER